MDKQMLYSILYLEVNMIAVLLVGIVRHKTRGISKMVAQRNFTQAIHAQIVFFLSDTFCVLMQNGMIPYSSTAMMAAKTLYFLSTAAMCFFWFVYFEYMQDAPFVRKRTHVWLASGLVWIMAALLVINWFTGIFFYVDPEGIYQRGTFFVVQYILSYIYILVACSRAFIGLRKKENLAKKKLLFSLVLFPIAPAGAGIIQFVYPQLPVACAALALSTLVLYLNWVDEMISIDPLTRLNNRKQLAYYYEQWSHIQEEDMKMYLLLIDANRFKSINDTYGHIEGDAALVRIADALRLSAGQLKRRTNIARYGGDEFVMLVWTETSEMVSGLCEEIQRTLSRMNEEAAADYELTVSIGIAQVFPEMPLRELIRRADEQMYEAKTRYQQLRGNESGR
ncbi:MAG: GGDEF domain-containing protein [Lachnospiraceae bacterium]|nr:GGDEF domain-containing protein [Lachnospiraceae bacterium]MBR1855368.1 GGDEF domain-containing protein [Lachnospiraceae bacterium]